MTSAEFVLLCPNFPAGELIIVSGPNFSATYSMLQAGQTAIEGSTPNGALLYDARATVTYTQRLWTVDTVQALSWEYVKDIAQEGFVVLIANTFDVNDPHQNPTPRYLEMDVMIDLMTVHNITDIVGATSKKYAGVREIFPWLSKIYYYDPGTDTVTFIKDQTSEVPM